MNKLRTSQKGFSLIEIVLVVAVLAIIGFLGWRMMSAQQGATDTNSSKTDTEEKAPVVNDDSDLKEAEDFLNDKDIDNTLNTDEIDAALSE